MRLVRPCSVQLSAHLQHARQVCKVPELEAWQLYLVDWGYNTPDERKRAQANPRIRLLSLGANFAAATGTAQ